MSARLVLLLFSVLVRGLPVVWHCSVVSLMGILTAISHSLIVLGKWIIDVMPFSFLVAFVCLYELVD